MSMNKEESTMKNMVVVDIKPDLQNFKMEFDYEEIKIPGPEWNPQQQFHLEPEMETKEESTEEIPVTWGEEPEESLALPMATTTSDPLSLDDLETSYANFACGLCQATFIEESLLTAHLSTHDDQTYSWRCLYCPEQFSRKILLTAHEQIHNQTKIILFECGQKTCKKCFNSVEALNEHMEIHHQNKTKEIPMLEYICKYCGEEFRSNTMLGKHLQTHAGFGLNPLTCEHCGKTFVRTSELERHLRTGSESENECPKCDRIFPFKCALSAHLKHDVHEKIFECEYCSKSFYLKIELDVHLKSHKKKRSHTCEECQRSFIRKDSLIKHKLLHTGEKPFKCEHDECDRAYISKEGLRIHQRSHGRHNF